MSEVVSESWQTLQQHPNVRWRLHDGYGCRGLVEFLCHLLRFGLLLRQTGKSISNQSVRNGSFEEGAGVRRKVLEIGRPAFDLSASVLQV